MKKKTSLTKLKKFKNKKQLTSEEANSIIPPSLVEPKKPRGKEKVHYVNSKEFEEEIQKFYNSEEWKKLRTEVFTRDNFTCQDCNKYGGYLEANHIKARSRHPDLKLVASNIETLCKPCHKKLTTEQRTAKQI